MSVFYTAVLSLSKHVNLRSAMLEHALRQAQGFGAKNV